MQIEGTSGFSEVPEAVNLCKTMARGTLRGPDGRFKDKKERTAHLFFEAHFSGSRVGDMMECAGGFKRPQAY